jgi:hypothetical protein
MRISSLSSLTSIIGSSVLIWSKGTSYEVKKECKSTIINDSKFSGIFDSEVDIIKECKKEVIYDIIYKA